VLSVERTQLGSLLQSTGQLAEAERLGRRAIRIFEDKLGPENMELATTHSNLADVMWARQDRASAAKLYRSALAIDESLYGPDGPELAADLVNLGLLLKEMGESAGESASLNRAVAIYEKAFGTSSLRCVNCWGRLGRGGNSDQAFICEPSFS
jgi:tetratricopeptide (TPR) repeat protein